MAEMPQIEQLFWSKVWRCSHRYPCKRCCWPWMRHTEDRYYTVAKSIWTPSIVAHRLAYILAHGAYMFPSGHGMFVICHRCDFKPCCNPAHLFVGTQKDNLRDASTKGYFQIQRFHPVLLPDGSFVDRRPSTKPTQLQEDWGAYLRRMRILSLQHRKA